jgi:peptide/nickel transport system permease protein
MKHAVPNALHPLVAYQGVVLPYMLTGEIEVAIVFGLATVGSGHCGLHGRSATSTSPRLSCWCSPPR